MLVVGRIIVAFLKFWVILFIEEAILQAVLLFYFYYFSRPKSAPLFFFFLGCFDGEFSFSAMYHYTYNWVGLIPFIPL